MPARKPLPLPIKLSLFFFFAMLFVLSCQQPEPDSAAAAILIDGRFDDWQNVLPAVTDTPGDAAAGALDLTKLWISDDAEYLFLRLKLEQDILLQNHNQLTLYFDIDDDPASGRPLGGIGAEIAFTFGQRRGWVAVGEDTTAIEYQHIGLLGAPSMTSNDFEISLAWNASREMEDLHFGKAPLRLLLRDEEGGDALPAIRYLPSKRPRILPADISLEKNDTSHLRLVTHNVNRRHMHADKRDAFTRIYRALQPDILLLEEAYDSSAAEILDYFRPVLGKSKTGQWFAYKAGAEATVLLSPFPARQVIPLGNSAAYLLDLRPHYDSELALIALSLPCCSQDSARQAEADQIMAFVRDLRSKGGRADIPESTPIVLAGDGNLVGKAEQYTTLIEGHISDTSTWGPAFAPDWDGSAFADLLPHHLQGPMTFTWRGRGFFPGRLDYFIYSESALKIGRRFVFDTPNLPQATLDRYNLKKNDALDTYKHLPLVADLIFN